jgi:hypothetical protein
MGSIPSRTTLPTPWRPRARWVEDSHVAWCRRQEREIRRVYLMRDALLAISAPAMIWLGGKFLGVW